MYREEEILLGILKDGLGNSKDEVLNITPDVLDNYLYLNSIYNEIFQSRFLTYSYDEKEIFKCLCSYYLLNGKNINEYTYNFIVNNKFEDVFDLFYNNSLFGCELLKNFYKCFLLKEVNVDLNYNEYREYDIKSKCFFLTDFIRNAVEKYYEKQTREGKCGEEIIDVLVKTINGKKPNDDNDLEIIYEYRIMLKKIIFADLYEDICMWNYTGLNDEIDVPDQLIVEAVKSNNCSLNYDDDINNYILGYFLELIYNPIRKKNNRSVLSKEDSKILSRVNPYYKFERSSN